MSLLLGDSAQSLCEGSFRVVGTGWYNAHSMKAFSRPPSRSPQPRLFPFRVSVGRRMFGVGKACVMDHTSSSGARAPDYQLGARFSRVISRNLGSMPLLRRILHRDTEASSSNHVVNFRPSVRYFQEGHYLFSPLSPRRTTRLSVTNSYNNVRRTYVHSVR